MRSLSEWREEVSPPITSNQEVEPGTRDYRQIISGNIGNVLNKLAIAVANDHRAKKFVNQKLILQSVAEMLQNIENREGDTFRAQRYTLNKPL